MKGSQFNLVITDVSMPVGDGFELLKYARAHHPETVIILLTGYGTIESAVEAIKAGGLRLPHQARHRRRRPPGRAAVAPAAAPAGREPPTQGGPGRQVHLRQHRRLRPANGQGVRPDLGRVRRPNHRADHGGIGHGQEHDRAGHPRAFAAKRTRPSWRSRARPCPTRCWRANCSAT